MAAITSRSSPRNCSKKAMFRRSSSTGSGSQIPGSTRQSISSRQKSWKGRSGRTVNPSSLFTGARSAA